tara:strand:- start:2331 stop:3230 length:900 start_codon:yes stop_codon:yes gene_type:complete
MKIKTPDADIGVIVGRFHTPTLHDGHLQLIQSVIDKHPNVAIVLGLSPLVGTKRNPLDYVARRQMIVDAFPDVEILYAKDMPCDKVWSKKLDDTISTIKLPNQKVLLYGSRDSFIPFYHGKFKVVELDSEIIYSATEERNKIGKKVKNDPAFRQGVIWATQTKYPATITTVDVAIIDWQKHRALMARKENETKYRFVGGYAEPGDDTFEQTAKREVSEETGLEVTDIKYIGSAKVDDWRYRGEVDKIKTLLFIADYFFGAPRAQDDIVEVRWFDWDELTNKIIVDEHKPLLKLLNKELS